MPRTPPTTDWNTRTKLDYLVQEALWKLLLESWDWAILLERSINTLWEWRTTPTTTWS